LAGGLVTVGSLGLFYLLYFAWNGWVPSTPYFLLFAALGFHYLASALIAARQGRGPEDNTYAPRYRKVQ
jgi:hypothetical protein